MAFTTLGFLVAIAVLSSANIESEKIDCRPEQVHIAYGDKQSEMVVMWSTIKECAIPKVQYGAHPFGNENTVSGTSKLLPGETSNVPYLHKVKLTALKPNTTYFYIPISNTISKGEFYFTTPQHGTEWQPEFMVYGDLGVHSESTPKLKLEAMRRMYTAVLHVGDFGYDMFENITDGPNTGENVGDVLMQQIQEMAAHIPYMVSPGNHETESDTFYQYRYRFSMPGTEWPIPLNKMFYSMDIGPVHFLSYSTEVFFVENGKYVQTQRDWILKDLTEANKHRHSQPWVIAFGHRPMYCTNSYPDDCTQPNSLVREGFEELFYKYGVDVVLQAHEHAYERLWPMYKGQTLSYNYINPKAPIQLITGAAGSKWGPDDMNTTLNASWSAFRMFNKSFNSYGRLKVYNSSHLYWEQVSVMENEVLDHLWIIQNSHAPFDQTIKEQIEKEMRENNHTPNITGDSFTKKVAKAIKGVDTKVIVGVSIAALGVLCLIIVCVIRNCRKRHKSYSKWEKVNYKKNTDPDLINDYKDVDEFEVDINDGTSKLISN